MNHDYDTLTTNNLLVFIYAEVTYFQSPNDNSVANVNSPQTLLKITEFMRGDPTKLIYVSQPNTIFDFTIYP